MAQGLRIWDASGNLTLDTSTRLPRGLGIITAPGATGSVTNAGLTTGDFWFILQYDQGSTSTPINFTYSVSGTTLSWSMTGMFYAIASYSSIKLTYGVY